MHIRLEVKERVPDMGTIHIYVYIHVHVHMRMMLLVGLNSICSLGRVICAAVSPTDPGSPSEL